MPKRQYQLEVHKDPQTACLAMAKRIVQLAANAIARKGSFTIALSGGSTPRILYHHLASEPFRGQVDWSKVIFFWGDERPVPPDDPESNFRMARESLLEPLEISEKQIHRMKGEMTDLAEAAQQYQLEIAQTLNVAPYGEPPSLDLILLGLGPEGHTASLFPATPALLETRSWATPNPVLNLGCTRLTLTPMFINRADNIYFLAVGAEKAEALAEVLEGFIDTQRLPAQLIHPPQGGPVWFVDEAAASKLKKKPGEK